MFLNRTADKNLYEIEKKIFGPPRSLKGGTGILKIFFSDTDFMSIQSCRVPDADHRKVPEIDPRL